MNINSLGLIFTNLLVICFIGCSSIDRNTRTKFEDEKIFNDFDIKNSTIAYKEFLQKYPQNTYAELAKHRIAESEDDALLRTSKIGTLQAFQGFVASYPNGKFAAEVSDRIQWLKKAKIGIIYNDIKNKHLDILKSRLEKFGYQIELLKRYAEANGKELSMLVLLNVRSAPNPYFNFNWAELTIKVIAGGISGGLIGATLAGLRYESEIGPKDIKWDEVIIKAGNVGGSDEYTRRLTGQFDGIFNLPSFYNEVVNTDLLEWIRKRKSRELPKGLLLAALRNDYYRYDRYFDLFAIDAMSNAENPPTDLIIEALKSNNIFVMLRAANALGKIKDPLAIGPLINTMRDKQWDCTSNTNFCEMLNFSKCCLPVSSICGDMSTALKEITGQDFGVQFEEWFKWWEQNK